MTSSAMSVLSLLVAYAVVWLTMYAVEFRWSTTVPITVEITDTSYGSGDASYVCWISPDTGTTDLQKMANKVPEGCSALEPGINTGTYVGHQFLVVHPGARLDDPPKIVTIQSGVTYVDIVTYENYRTDTAFDYVVEWQRLLLQRRQVATAVAIVLLVTLLLSNPRDLLSNRLPHNTKSKSAIGDDKKGKHAEHRELAVCETRLPRHWIKCYAVVNMLLNHIGYVFIRNNKPLQTAFTLLADAGGSMHIFNWLVGYNTSRNSKSSEILLLLAFVFLNQCVDLPRPVTYETLLSISLIRLVLQARVFHRDAKTDKCAAADAHILVHAASCVAILLLGRFVGAEGLKLTNVVGILYACSGRLYAIGNVDLSNRMLWLSAAVLLTLRSSINNITVAHRDNGVWQWVYGISYVTLTILNATVINWPPSSVVTQSNGSAKDKVKVTHSAVPLLIKLMAHYSLEIYIGHFLILKLIYEWISRAETD